MRKYSRGAAVTSDHHLPWSPGNTNPVQVLYWMLVCPYNSIRYHQSQDGRTGWLDRSAALGVPLGPLDTFSFLMDHSCSAHIARNLPPVQCVRLSIVYTEKRNYSSASEYTDTVALASFSIHERLMWFKNNCDFVTMLLLIWCIIYIFPKSV